MEKKLQKKNISYIAQFINSTRFMSSSLSNLVDNLSEGIHRTKCKFGDDDKKCEICRMKYKSCAINKNNFVNFVNTKHVSSKQVGSYFLVDLPLRNKYT